MYDKCIKCKRLGQDCFPNLYVMNVEDIRDWAKRLKEEKGMTNAELAKASGVPKGTIDSNFSHHKKSVDVNYSTFAPVLCALIGNHKEKSCMDPNSSTQELEVENARLKEEIAEFDSRIEYFKEQMKWRKKIILFLIALSCALLAIILIELTIDWYYNELGFFWLN